MPSWGSPSVEVLFGTSVEEILVELESSIAYYRHNKEYAETKSQEFGPTVASSESAVNALRYVLAYSELLRQKLQPYWFGFELEDTKANAIRVDEGGEKK